MDVPPSPKSQAKLVIVPSLSLDPTLLKLTAVPASPVYGPLASAVGATFAAAIVAVAVSLSLAPSLSVTVSVTVKVPALA